MIQSQTSTGAQPGATGAFMGAPITTNNRGYWPWIPLATYQPASMMIPEDQKDEAYHSTWTRFFLSRQVGQWINYYRQNYVANMDYAIDSRWGEESDIRMFLGDSSAQTTRIPFKFPILSPTLTRMIGAVDNISITAKAEPATQHFAQTRKEARFQEAMLMSEAAAAGPMMAQAYADKGISPDKKETEKFFDMTYQDHISRGANSLMSMLSVYNELDETKRVVAGFMALSGLGVIHNYIDGSNIESEICEPREVGWDTSAMKPDLSDGQFVYVCPLLDVGQVAQRWSPKADIIKALDLWARMIPAGYNFQAGWPQSRPRVFTMYWKDFKKYERGFVMKDGELDFCIINQVNEETGKPDYTDADLVVPPQNKYTAAWTYQEKKDKKQVKYMEVIRYCSMIPWEYLPGGYTKGIAYNANLTPPKPDGDLPLVNVAGDIVLDYGEYQLQEADPDNVYKVKFPIKLSAWRYLGGHVVAPLTAARDPQRWMNQLTSDIAWRMRKAGGSSPIIASEVVNGTNMTEQDVMFALKEGDPIFAPSTQIGGLQNAASTIDTSPNASFYNMVGLMPQIKQVAESSVGVYESNYGAPQGQDQLVGTLQLQLQQAGVMQQPFYACIADLYKQQNQFYAQAGKQFYARMPWLLRQMVGEEDMEALIMSKDMQLEQFRVKIELAPDGAQQRLVTDQQIIPNLMQLGMLDPVTAAQLMGRSIPDDVYAASRQYTKQAQEAAAAAQQQAAQQAQQQEIALEQAQIRDEEADIAAQDTKAKLEMAKVQQKMAQPSLQAEADWMKPPDPVNPTRA